MSTIRLSTLLVIALLAIAAPATAQFYPPIVLDPSLTKFFDPDSAFRESVEFILRSPDGKADRWPVRVAMSKGMNAPSQPGHRSSVASVAPCGPGG